MKAVVTAAVISSALIVPSAHAKSIPIHFASRTVSCRVTYIEFSIESTQGVIAFNAGYKSYVDATTRGAWIDSSCKTIRLRRQPKPFLPSPSDSGDGGFGCETPSPLIIHVQYLRSGGHVSGIYASARTRTGRYIAAGLLTSAGVEREYVASSCTAVG